MFHYSSYWRSWSRVLSTDHTGGPFVEVNLTPIGNSWVSEDQVRRIQGVNIRLHGTARDPKDIETAELPVEVMDQMADHLGVWFVDELLNTDFMPQIDWDLYKRQCNGGCPFHLCSTADSLKD